MEKLLKTKISVIHKIILIVSLIMPFILHAWVGDMANIDMPIIYKVLVTLVSLSLPITIITSFVDWRVRDNVSIATSIIGTIILIISAIYIV